MTDTAERPLVRRSIFAKLLTIMLSMAVSLLIIASGFFLLIISPNVSSSMEPFIDDYVRAVAAASPDFEEAKRLRSRVNLLVRYEGPHGSWTTSEYLPSIASIQRRQAAGAWRLNFVHHNYHVVPAPQGGSYLFAWTFGRNMKVAHVMLLCALLGLMTVVILTAHAVLKRLLLPMRLLGDGVARLGAGELDVELPNRTRDEFGVLTDAFNRMVRRVREMIQARDQLLLDVSHELRSPLTRLKVALALLPDGSKARQMNADVAQMEHMITELLELERLRDGRGLRLARENFTAILQEVVSGFQDRAPGVELICASDEMPLEIDADEIRKLLGNLLENAIKYSLPDSRAVAVSAAHDEYTVVVRVADDGVGIPDGDLAKLFDPFFRVDRSRSRKTGGYGLGLSICKRIAEAHGGAIQAERNAGRGASFIVTLPKPPPAG